MAKKDGAKRDGAAAGAKKPRFQRLKQVGAVFTMTRKSDPAAVLWMAVAFAVPVLLTLLVGVLMGAPVWYLAVLLVLGVMLGLLAALFVLTRRAERAAYAANAHLPGITGASLRTLRRGWVVEEQPVAVDPRTQDMVFRAVGRPGVVLLTEGPLPRVKRLADGERKRVQRLVPGVEVHVLHAGDGEGQVPLRKVTRRVTRLRPTLTKPQAAEVAKRLKALGGVRMPVPKGVDPFRARPDRKAMRGR